MNQDDHILLEYLGKKYYIFFNDTGEVDIFEEYYDRDFLNRSLDKRLKMDRSLDEGLKRGVVVVPFNGGLHLAEKFYQHYRRNKLELRFLAIENYSYVGKQKKKEVVTDLILNPKKRREHIEQCTIEVNIPEKCWVVERKQIEKQQGLIVCDDVYDEGHSLLEILIFLKSAFKDHSISAFYEFHKIENHTNRKKKNFELALESIKESKGEFYAPLIFTDNHWIAGCGADIGSEGYEHVGRNIDALILKIPAQDRLYTKVLEQYKKSLDIRQLQ